MSPAPAPWPGRFVFGLADRLVHQKIMRKRSAVSMTAVFAVVIVTIAPSLFAKTVWLSSLDLKQMTTGWGDPHADREINGNPLKIGGATFDHGVGTHAISKMRVNL